jgi:phosphoribosylformylglycinamidine (FGAM) synthase-like amidotransferase family enzyme
VFRALAFIDKVPQITAIQFWGWRGGSTSERGIDSEVAHLRAITDEHGRILVLMSHNTDVADAWEREGEDPLFFKQFSPNGYALGINVLLYAMSH